MGIRKLVDGYIAFSLHFLDIITGCDRLRSILSEISNKLHKRKCIDIQHFLLCNLYLYFYLDLYFFLYLLPDGKYKKENKYSNIKKIFSQKNIYKTFFERLVCTL